MIPRYGTEGDPRGDHPFDPGGDGRTIGLLYHRGVPYRGILHWGEIE